MESLSHTTGTAHTESVTSARAMYATHQDRLPDGNFNANSAEAAQKWTVRIPSGSTYTVTQNIMSNETAGYRSRSASPAPYWEGMSAAGASTPQRLRISASGARIARTSSLTCGRASRYC